jgi:nucleoside-diphosphate-sugar epimerase
MKPRPEDAAKFFEINSAGTACLARSAAAAGIRRFVYLSTIKVLGEVSATALRETDPVCPADAYAESKLRAEEAIRATSTGDFEHVILRPPLVYGPGVGANFVTLMRAVQRGAPLPLASVRNSRSFVSIENLSDAIIHTLVSSAAVNRTFHVSDGEDMSTADLVRRLAQALRVRPRLFPLPPFLIHLMGKLAGRSGASERLLGSLALDISAIRASGWAPPQDVDEALAQTAAWYLAQLEPA